MVQTRELRLGLEVVKHTIQKALQVDSALHVETHFFIVEFTIEHEICKQHLLGLVVVNLLLTRSWSIDRE
jgi:hypothetical protein